MLVKCPWCNGTKQYLMNGDAHRSSGIVPCYSCDADGNYEQSEYTKTLLPPKDYSDKYLHILAYL